MANASASPDSRSPCGIGRPPASRLRAAGAAGGDVEALDDGRVPERQGAPVVDAGSVDLRIVVGDSAVCDNGKTPTDEDAAAHVCIVVADGAIPEGETANATDAATEVRHVVADGAVLEGKIATAVDAAAAAAVGGLHVVADGAVLEGETAIVEDAGAYERVTALHPDFFDRHHRATFDRYHPVAAPAVNDGVVFTRTANRHVTIDREMFLVGSGRNINNGARGFIERLLDGGIVAGHVAGRRGLSKSAKDRTSGQEGHTAARA